MRIGKLLETFDELSIDLNGDTFIETLLQSGFFKKKKRSVKFSRIP